jgi:hypothetical protein
MVYMLNQKTETKTKDVGKKYEVQKILLCATMWQLIS